MKELQHREMYIATKALTLALSIIRLLGDLKS
jgi:hypothetical protein